MTLIIGLIVGGIVVHKFSQLRKSIENRGGFTITIRGYELRLSKKKLSSVVPAPIVSTTAAVAVAVAPPAVQTKKKTQVSDCEFCHGEPITIAGSKDTMPCPECKKKSTA